MPENLVPFRPIGERVIVHIYDDGTSTFDLGNGAKLITGLVDTNFDSLHDVTDGRHPGIRPRWAIVTAVNDHTPDYLQPGTKVLLDTMKWRRGVFAGEGGRKIWDIPFVDILCIDEDGLDEDEMIKVAEYLVGFDNGLVAAADIVCDEGETPETKITTLANWQ